MRVALIGLGAIAQKAYLPILTARPDVEILLCTRNQAVLDKLSRSYRLPTATSDLGRLLEYRPQAAFVHAATEAHVPIVEQLLQHGVAVYVDKPLAYSYTESQRLVELARQQGRLLMVGFNRRFAPMYSRLKAQPPARLVLMQKNRTFLPDAARRFVFDDFIHVVDTLRYLAPAAIQEQRVSWHQQAGLLYHLTLELSGESFTLIGMMNRDSGTTEEVLELMAPGNKWVVQGLNSTIHYADGQEYRQLFNDWDPILYRRGFEQIIDHFLGCAAHNDAPAQTPEDALDTHRVCEQIVAEIERDGS